MKQVYFYDEGDGKNKKLLGGKGAGLCEMTKLKLPVPPGFTITTEVCRKYYENNKKLPKTLMVDVKKNIAKIEKRTGKKWNSKTNPLLVSVRSGAAISMPGMMDTILNLGLNDQTVLGLEEKSQNPRFAWDSYRRFIQLFGKVVFGVDDKKFDDVLNAAKKKQNVQVDSDLNEESLREVVEQYKQICDKHTGRKFPTDPTEQVELAIKAVFGSWMGERAIVYREKNNITKDIADGTAVNIVSMAFGNMGNDCATGVVFTRNPGDGSRQIYGEYLINAQGEDVVAGVRTGKQVNEMKKDLPESYKQLTKTCERLEKHYKEPQDIEFTIEQGKFYLLQTRNAKMNASGMIKTSVDMVKEKLIDKNRAITRLQAEQLEQLLHKRIDPKEIKNHTQLAKGIAASPGAASGIAVLDVKRATAMGENGAKVILIREETKPEDVPAFFESVGILTSRGGKTSHAAVVARGMGKPCIVGCSDLKIDLENKQCSVDGKVVREGEVITIDGSTGSVYIGDIPTIEPKVTSEFKQVLEWAQKAKKIGIRANADTPEGAKLAREFGGQGIGLCRTERMFNGSDRINLFVEMIMAENIEERNKILTKLGQLQKSDFIEILQAMEGYEVTIRLLDPPLHEFLPNPEELAEKIRKLELQNATEELNKAKTVLKRARELAEVNPMMGHRGVRVGITYPEIYEMQIRAVFEALVELTKKKVKAHPQIMIPQISSIAELNHIKKIYDSIKKEMETKHKMKLKINFGTMIEVVRAALTANELASTAEFFSFGTNDLTQGTFSFSREDVEGKFLPEYIEKEILERNPFQSIDVNGVGSLIKIGIAGGRGIRPNMEIGICGEHGGDPNSIKFCHGAGLSYVSASPHRIPIAIVAAAQAAIEQPKKTKSKKK
ncbi:MAG: pyruvate, phosphate dikinase [Nitrosopumilus sp.]|uniref:pyruvate, phosphate dikinase n=1 Tax=Nitrosopumilus zosterae TaxID=718286 RepID=A0A2S2KSD5_9ARCH|nr:MULTISPECIES: pyruvate, phosphate dikinase [Nitrosopumilus]MCV0366878.1 pyruvate, phosphate dikinase [Nitrosopumilus sp.]BDQ30821.1 pyruvate, phosphate dikinase [Nitrosopumilus zosterae]GBH34563.1 pyruvate, phosphate dikinase [Nitrosopumilus zosterae]